MYTRFFFAICGRNDIAAGTGNVRGKVNHFIYLTQNLQDIIRLSDNYNTQTN